MDRPLIVVDRESAKPIVAQLADGFRWAVLDGRLRVGDAVPSTRALAGELGVARSTVVSAYEQLAGEGYLELRQGAATRVATSSGNARSATTTTARATTSARATASASGHSSPSHKLLRGDTRPLDEDGDEGGDGHEYGDEDAGEEERAAARIDLLPGHPSTARIDRRTWRSAWRRAAARDIPSTVPAPFGEPRLRAAIADHVRHARGVACDADDVAITAGTSDAVGLLASALQEVGARVGADPEARPGAPARPAGAAPRVAVEDPGYPGARRVLERRGIRVVPIPVAADGFDVTALERMPHPPDAVMVTPSHQYPLGGRLPVAERLRLLAWAARHDRLVFEDDYDSEFRHTGAPLPALATLDDGARVVLVGSLSKVLTPAVRLGYLVLPRRAELRDAIAVVRADETCPVAVPAQHAVADLLERGAVRRGIAAARRDYAHRRGLVLDALDGLRGATLTALDGGLHGVLVLDDAARESGIVARLAGAGVDVAPLSAYATGASRAGARTAPDPAASTVGTRGGLVFGYAAAGDLQLAEALRRIREAVAAG